MTQLAEAISMLLTLTQGITQGAQAAVEISALIKKANSEGRDITDEELNVARGAATAARDRLTGTKVP